MKGRAIVITALIVLGLASWVAWDDPGIRSQLLQFLPGEPVDTLAVDTVLSPEVKSSGVIQRKPPRKPRQEQGGNTRQTDPLPASTSLRIYYLDISERQDRAMLLDSLERGLQESDNVYLYLSGGDQKEPWIGREKTEYAKVMQAVSQQNPSLPTLSLDVTRLLADEELLNRIAAADQVDLRFYLSATIYQLSTEILIEAFLPRVKALQSTVQVRVYVEPPLPNTILSDPSIQTIVLPATG